MFKNKNQVDLHVQNIFKRCNNDTERNMRCYHFAKLYKEVGDYESARRFIVRYLTAREDSADAHKLYGHILLGLKQKKKALAEFKCSLELDRYQYELLPKVCHILAELDEPLDLDRAQYWVDRTKPHFPNNSAVFRLRERIISEREKQNKTNSSYQGVDELEALIAAELAIRPGDVPLRVRLLQLYLRANRVNDAFSHAMLSEAKGTFRNDLQWYECLTDVFEKASQEKKNDWEFVAGNLNVLERLSALSLEEYRVVDSGITRRSNVDCAKILHNFDKALHSASQLEFASSEREFFHEFLKHMRGQLVLHLATLIFRKVKEPSSWRKASKAAGALLLLAVRFGGDAPPDPQPPWAIRLSDARRKEVARWAVETSFRVSQAGHILMGMLRDRGSHFLEQIGQFCTGAWREQVYQIAIGTLYEKEGEKDSHFLQFQNFAHPSLELPSITDILSHDEMAQKLHPGSLHHMIWLGLEVAHCVAPSNKRLFQIPPDFSCIVFEGLSFGNNLAGGPESITQLDIDAFLYATIYSSAAIQEEWSNGTKLDQLPSCLPAALTDPLCSPAQAQWWSTAYQLLSGQLLSKSERKDDTKADVGERRLTLQRGLEVIRAVGNHGLGPELSVKLARTFVKRAKILSTSSVTSSNEVRALEERANLYWAAALPILERMARSQAVHYPQKRLFEYRGKPLSNAEVVSLLDEAHLAMAVKMMMEGKDEEAINAFLLLKVPEASYYLALIYKKLAAQEANIQAVDEITPETRSRQIALYTKAKECLHLTQKRLRSNEYDRSHPIAIGVGKELEDLEIKFDRLNDSAWVDPDQTVISGMLAESMLEDSHKEKSWSLRKNWPSSAGNGVLNDSRMHSTPVKKTPSRMGNGVPARDASVEESHQSFSETVNMLKDLKLWLADEISSMKTGMAEIKDQVTAIKEDVAKLKTSRHQTHHTSEMPRQATEGRDAEEDIYVYGDEDEYGEGEEVNIAAAAAASAAAAAAAAAVAAQTQGDKYGAYPGTGYPYQGYPTYRQMSGVQGAATVTYGAPTAPTQAPPPTALLPPSIAPFFPLAGAPVDPSLIPPNAAGMYHSSLRYYGQGALPFSEGQQLPDFRGDARNLSGVPLRPPLIGSVMGAHPDVDRGTPPYHSLGTDPSYMMDKHMAGPPPPTLPENVVITSSDTLPTSAPPNQPPLSVVIPPRHRLGTPASPAQPAKLSLDTMTSTTSVVTTSTATTAAPHAFQISMPPQAQIPTQPPLDKTVSAIPPVETDKLLSSVPSPVHSAVSGDKTTPKASRTSTSPKSRTPRKSLGEEDDEVGEADDSVEHDPCPDFQPVIPLPAVVETHTGEEEETLLFSSRCKLYRFMDREWKERGIGIIKILHNQSTGKARIIMRREQVFKVCANHFITPDMSLSPVAGAKGLAWLWVANDFADEEVKLEKLSARFKTSADAEGFKEAFEKAKKIVAEAKPDKTSSEGEKGDKEKLVGVEVPTSDSQKITSSGVGSQKVTSSTMEPVKVTQTPQPKEDSSSISTPAEKLKVVLEGFTFVSPPTLKQIDDDKKKEEDKKTAAKPNIFASFSFGQTPAPPTGGITWGKPTVGISATPDSSTKDGAKPAKTGDQTGKPMDSEKKDVAAIKSDSTPKTSETPSKTTFGSPLGGVKGEGDGEDGDFMPTAEFKPVIPLPELVEVKTGEEGEDILFEHRAKLLRYANKEWIEFGIGQMKITLNPSTGKVRLIMRREQVLKVCCNHFLTEDMQFMPLKTSDRCWTWHAQDYADGTLTPKTLAIKFKGSEEAAKFKQVIDDLQKNMVDGKAKLDKTGKDKAPESPDNSGSCKGNVDKLFDLFKPEAGSWECKECYIRNKGDTKSCVACSTVRPGFVDNSAKEDEKSSFSPFKFGITPQATPSSQVQAPTPAFSIGTQPTFAPSQTVSFKFGSTSTPETPKSSGFVASAETPKAAAPQTKKTEGMPSLSSLFKPEEGSWECSWCYLRNKKDITKCIYCCAQKPGTVATEDVPKSQVPQTTFTFGIPSSKPDSKTDSVDVLKNQAPQATFTFGIPTSTPDTKNEEPPDAQKGLGRQVTFSFGAPTSTSDTKKSDPAKDAAVVSKPSEGFGSLAAAFKPEEGSWECSSCYVRNKKDVIKCSACGELKPGQPAPTTTTAGETSAPPAFRFGVQPDSSAESKPTAATTAFTFCTSTVPTVGKTAVDAWAPAKFTFGASQPSVGATASSATPLFNQALTSFTFGATTTGSKPTEEKKVADPVTGFTFNSNQKYEFHFKGVDPKINALGSSPSSKGSYFKSPDRQISHDESGGSDLYQEEDDGDHIHFQPVIPLPDKVPLHTGEENEEVLYQHRAKLYRWSDKEWKERGYGDIKLLKHLEDGRVRMLMRREQVLKICLNHYVTDEVFLTPKGDRAWQWTAVDFSEGEGTPELFSIRFKSADIAESFREAFDEAKAGAGKPREKREEGEKTPTPKTPTNTPQVGYPINKSPAMQAFSFKLASESTPPSTTAPRFSLDNLFGNTSSPPKTPASDVKSTTLQSEVSSEVEVVFERKTSEMDRQAAIKLMLPPNFYAYNDKPPCPGCMGCENYDQEKLDRFFARDVRSTSKVERDGKEGNEEKSKEESTSSVTVTSTTTADSTASIVQKTEQSQEEKNDYGLPFLKVESNLSFASIAAASSSQSGFGPSPKTKSVVWGGVITPVFGSASKTTSAAHEGGESEGEGDEEGAVETHDPHYAPIVPLPALINVRTGEEDETKVFGDRAKLYRFDSNTKEWKERGVGELKILFHPVNHTYRFLLRRELVHKLVLNHLITADFDLKEMKKSDQSYVWYATNYAEDTPELEQLCAKFKNQDLARQFAETVKRCVDDVAAYQASKSLQDISGQECDVSQSVRQYEEDEEDEEYDEEGEDDDDEYEEVDDEELERRTIFEKRGRMDVREGDEWKTLGTGDIKVIYEPEFLGTILTLEVNGLVKCNALITTRSTIKAKEKSFECSADDLSHEEALTRNYRVKLSSNVSALEFETAFKQGVSIALEPQLEEDHK